MDVVEGGPFQSSSMAKASRDFVFVHLHQTRGESVASYKLLTGHFLPEEFLHPAYFFLRPDGAEADRAHRHHHEALSSGQMLGVLKAIQREWGPGLSLPEYEKAKGRLEKALSRLAAGEWEEGGKFLLELSGLRANCGIRDRARAFLRTIEVRRDLLAAWEALGAETGGLAGPVAERLRAGDLAGAFRRLRRAGAREDFQERLLAALRELIRLGPVSVEEVLAGGLYHYLRGEWASDLAEVDGLGFQISYLTDRNETLEGYGVFDDVRPHRHHRIAASLTPRELRYGKVVNARVQLFLEDVLLHEAVLRPEPVDFPPDESHVKTGPEPLREEECLAAGVKGSLRFYRLGRYRAP